MWFLFTFIFTLNLISSLSETEIHQSATEKTYNNDLPESNFFLDYIFKKYGSINGKISYEGFEHLLENLGLGVKFDKDHTLEEHKSEEGYFKEIHETLQLHKHNHTDKRRSERSSDLFDDEISRKYSPKLSNLMNKHCFTPEEMLVIYNLEPNHELSISPTNFLHMCPVIVYELDQKSCNFYHGNTDKHLRVKMDNIYFVWLSATVTVFVISLVGLLGVCMVPLLQKAFFNELLSFLVALAVGTLCGDAFLHLLPHAFKTENSEHDNIVVLRAGVVFLTVVFFFVIENLLCKSKTSNKVSSKEDEHVEADVTHKVDIQLQEKSMLHTHSHSPSTAPRSISSVAYMVIMGDGLHNLTDGLAIGAAFSGDVISGFSTAIAVFTHELPHELGDFAVLLQTGMTVSQAVYFNIISSILSFIGMVIGLLLGNFTSASQWIYAATAGAFLYIGLVNLMPEIKRPVGNGKTELLIQFSGIFCGGLIMLLIALFEHELENIFLQ